MVGRAVGEVVGDVGLKVGTSVGTAHEHLVYEGRSVGIFFFSPLRCEIVTIGKEMFRFTYRQWAMLMGKAMVLQQVDAVMWRCSG